jgi:arylamine N-acetyltransferase
VNPLDPPLPFSPVLRRFLDHFRIDSALPEETLLEKVIEAFAALPYENLTKIIRRDAAGFPELARRGPAEVIGEHVRLGAGGTCFSLTAALLHLVRALGWRAEPILADRHYGENTHCALLVWVSGTPRLVDPGYLLARPVPFGSKEPVSVRTAFNDVVLSPREGGKVDLLTVEGRSRSVRLTFHATPADPGELLRAWDASFSWEMMRYPLLTRVRDGKHIYLQEDRLRVRGEDGASRREVPPAEMAALIAAEFGLERRIAERALEILERGH